MESIPPLTAMATFLESACNVNHSFSLCCFFFFVVVKLLKVDCLSCKVGTLRHYATKTNSHTPFFWVQCQHQRAEACKGSSLPWSSFATRATVAYASSWAFQQQRPLRLQVLLFVCLEFWASSSVASRLAAVSALSHVSPWRSCGCQ